MKFRLIFALICLLLIVQAVSAENVITNGDFETGDFTGWDVTTTSANADASVVEEPHNGSYSAKLHATGNDENLQTAKIEQTVNLSDVETLVFYYKNTEAYGAVEFEVRINGTDVFSKGGTTDGWQKVEINVTTYTGLNTISFRVWARKPFPNSVTGIITTYVDDIVAEAGGGGSGSGNVTEEEGNTTWVVSFKVYRCFKPVVNVPVVVSYNGNVTGSGYTDDTGSVAFRLDKLKSYVVNVNDSEKVVTVQPVENNYIITLPCNLSQEWEEATYNVTTGSYPWDLLTTAQNLSSQLSPSAKGFLSGLVAWLAMYGVSAVGVNAAPVGVIALVGLAVVGLADWVAVLLCCVFMVAMYIIRRGIG